MQESKISMAFAFVLLCAGCRQHATAPTPAATGAATQGDIAQADPDAQCKSWGIQPGSPDFKRCVDGMTEAANAGGPQNAEQAPAEMAKMRADMAHHGDDVRKQVDDEMKAAASNPKCVTVSNGTNTSVSCP